MLPGIGCTAPTCALVLFVCLACVTLGVNGFSTAYALAQVRAGRAEPPGVRANDMLLLARCLTLLVMVVVAVALWRYPYWLVGVALATAIVQALDLSVGIALRSRKQIGAALLALGVVGPTLALFLVLGAGQ